MAGTGPSHGQSIELRRAGLDALRAADIDRYLALLLAPEEAQADLSTLLLFNAEIAAIRDRIREPLPGEIRLQWWRDVLDGQRVGEAEAHPLASSLLEMIARRGLPLTPLSGMCEARVFDLYDDPMPDRTSYEGYAGETASALLQLSAFLLDADAAAQTATVSGHAGVAQAVAGHLMLLPISQARGQVFIPGDLLAATGLDRDSLLAGKNKMAIEATVQAFAGFGRDHLAKARKALRGVPATVQPAYLSVALVEPVLKRAEKLGARCLEVSPRPSQWRRQWWLWRSARSGHI
jgi:phytoene synthase